MQQQLVALAVDPPFEERLEGRAVGVEDQRVAAAAAGAEPDHLVFVGQLLGHGEEVVVGEAVHVADLQGAGDHETADEVGPGEFDAGPAHRQIFVDVGLDVLGAAPLALLPEGVDDDLDDLGRGVQHLAFGGKVDLGGFAELAADQLEVGLGVAVDQGLAVVGAEAGGEGAVEPLLGGAEVALEAHLVAGDAEPRRQLLAAAEQLDGGVAAGGVGEVDLAHGVPGCGG